MIEARNRRPQIVVVDADRSIDDVQKSIRAACEDVGFFILSATLLGWCFTAIAQLISVLVEEKSRAAGLALITWFWFVLVFDLLLLGILVIGEGRAGEQWLAWLLMLNPTDVFRLANLAGFDLAATQLNTGDFRRANMTGVSLAEYGILPDGMDFSGSIMVGAQLSHNAIHEAAFVGGQDEIIIIIGIRVIRNTIPIAVRARYALRTFVGIRNPVSVPITTGIIVTKVQVIRNTIQV